MLWPVAWFAGQDVQSHLAPKLGPAAFLDDGMRLTKMSDDNPSQRDNGQYNDDPAEGAGQGINGFGERHGSGLLAAGEDTGSLSYGALIHGCAVPIFQNAKVGGARLPALASPPAMLL